MHSQHRYRSENVDANVVFFTALLCWQSVWAAEQSLYLLPTNPKHVVLLFDSLGGMLPRADSSPLLTVTADGTVTVNGSWHGGKAKRGRLNSEQLQNLLDFVIAQQHFPRLNSEEIQLRMKALGRRDGRMFAVADAPTTVIALDLPEGQWQIEFYAVDSAAAQFPEIPELQNLRAILQSLRGLAEKIE